MNCVICDDDPLFAEQLEERIRGQCVQNDWEYRCRQADTQTLLALDLSAVDVLFLDIEMPDINGLEAAKQIRQRYDDLLLVFVTGFIDYAVFKAELTALIDSDADSLRFYRLGNSYKAKVEHIGLTPQWPQDGVLLV